MISRILFTTGVVSAMAVVGPVRAQGEDDALSSDESGTAMWMDAMDEAHARDKRVPTKAGVSVASEAGSGVYRVHEGDTLWDISSKELGNAYDWPRLWSYNPEITNPHWIYPDSEVRLAPAGGGVATSTAPTSSLTPSSSNSRAYARRRSMAEGEILLGDEAFMDASALHDAGYILGSHEQHMLMSPSDWVYVRFPSKPPVAVGEELTVFRALDENDEIPKQEGHVIRIQGVLKLMDYDEKRKLGRALIVEALDPIERGFRVSDTKRRFSVTAMRPASRKIDAKIVASVRPRYILGTNYVVFVNVGSEDGLELGNRMFVIRKGDVWRENIPSTEWSGAIVPDPDGADDADWPEEIEAEGRVVDVRRHSATVLITRAVVELEYGDIIRTIEGR